METQTPVPWLRTRLSVLMFLQFAVWGAWAPVLFKHLLNLRLNVGQAGAIMGTGPLALMISPLIAGQIADRWFSTQRFLSISFIGSAALLSQAVLVTNASEFGKLWWFCFGAMLLFGPTLGLANALCFHHLKDPRADFPLIRVWGTVGWIASSFVVSWIMQSTGIDLRACLLVGSLVAALLSIYCLTLPNTPPVAGAREKFAVAKTLAMAKDFSFTLFSFLAFVLMVFATFYYFMNADFFPTLGISDAWLGPTQTIGQAAEIITMFLLPIVYKKLGSKKTIALGLFAWALRFAVFSLGEPAGLVIASQSLHGVCFAFGIAGAMIYFERICEPDVRGSVQSFLAWITYGFGMFVGSLLLGPMSAAFSSPALDDPKKMVLDWHKFWAVPAAGCFVILIVFMLGFRARDTQPES